MEAKLLNGTAEQYHALDEAIRTAQFVRNKRVRYWMDNRSVNKAVLYAHCKGLAKEFDFARKLNSAARQASAERAWASISRFHTNCRNKAVRKGYPQFKKNCRSVEYKLSGWKLSPDGMSITFTDGFNAGTFALYCNGEARHHILKLQNQSGAGDTQGRWVLCPVLPGCGAQRAGSIHRQCDWH
jgi:putative transposase